ncbi:class I SAM-dependent methyltransferase [Opitutus terrae]|uniref:Methyltransferase type 11 n=1 Tax=Opitutus terrae (strain DSM 11246 / JCM 15787 / PB90-1) TaxID=452637 RepID=B1ZZR2_OPITP|nr:class I SAM-dependent methyltransferase [Opitutus terrae]ACB77248.1 Methyltransferase type 11 [Opitutus terrae PB90-1]
MTHENKVARWLLPLESAGGIGVEIGPFKTPVPGIKPIYVDRFKEYAGEKCLADYHGDAANLPFRDNSLAYVVSSHVLEHTANPVAAFAEWYRVLRPGGIIYVVVPDRRYTWDHARALTSIDHMLEDYERSTTAVDATHVDDFVDGVDWSTYSPGTKEADVFAAKAALKATYHQAVATGNEINIHFHVFEPGNVLGLLGRLQHHPRLRFHWCVVDQAERFPANNPNGFLAVVRVQKSWRHRLRTSLQWAARQRSWNTVLLPSALPLNQRPEASECPTPREGGSPR